jgi:RNA polymerase sigma-70 factor, ECF subfamily
MTGSREGAAPFHIQSAKRRVTDRSFGMYFYKMAGHALSAHPAGNADDPRSDRELVEATLAGDRRASEALVRRYLPRAYALAYHILGNRQDAEDLVQDAWIAALDALETIDLHRPFAPWFFRIVVNKGLNTRRSQKVRTNSSLDGFEAAGADNRVDDPGTRGEIRDRFAEAVSGLPPRQRAIVQLFEVEGYDTGEIAEMLGMSTVTVRWHLHEARARLRRALAPLRSDRTAG